MIEKIKDIVKWVITPLLLIMGYIFHLLGQNERLRNDVAKERVEKDLAEVILKKEEAKGDADKLEADYTDALNEYRNPDRKG